MKRNQLRGLLALCLFATANAPAVVRYVDMNSASPTPPYTNWSTAAVTIQDAIDAAMTGDQILVTNGVYQTGGKTVAVTGLAATNRVAVDKAVAVQSMNGPQFTVIQGYQVPGTTNGDGAIRCVYLTDGASLSGFTLTNGATTTDQSGGGLICDSEAVVVSNCVMVGNSAYWGGGGAASGTLNNCTLTRNSGRVGGGAYYGRLNNCTLSGNSAVNGAGANYGMLNNCTLSTNSASYGGGAHSSALNNCTITGNSASYEGGGAFDGTLSNCMITGNDSYEGGGAFGGSSILNNCIVSSNSAVFGGGAYGSTLNNCMVTRNYGNAYGGGSFNGTLNNCTITGNSTGNIGGGAGQCTLRNCIVYFNSASQGAPNAWNSSLNYCCTTPNPGGVGNISANPQLASLSHLSASSPCRGAGSASYATGTDFDGEIWASPPSIGCDEYHAGAVTGSLRVDIATPYTSVLPGYSLELTAMIEGRAIASAWDFGDGLVASNRPYASHSWASLGNHMVILRAYNESQPAGISATVTVHVVEQPVHYVAAISASPLPPFTSWATAARNIQDAVDAAAPGALVLVNDGYYGDGGTTFNQVAVNKALTLRSNNGPRFTVINGGGAVRCVYLTNGASLSGFTLINGVADAGGGVLCQSATVVVSNCVLIGNSATYYGGGTIGGTLNNCTLSGNAAPIGGGAYYGTLNNCTLTGNSAGASGGGVFQGTLNNCIVYLNKASAGANYGEDSSGSVVLNYCCTTPMPTNGIANITNEPLFVNQAGGNLRLQSNSLCINSGLNAYAPAGSDLDGNPRIAGGTVDIGAYEFQSPASVISYAWLQRYGLIPDASVDTTDADRDGPSNWQEWIAGTDPTNALSRLRLLKPAHNVSGMVVTWQSVSNRTYFLERSINLGANPAFLTLATNLTGQPGTTSYTDTYANGSGPYFYRVGVQTGSNQFHFAASIIPFAWLQQFGLPTDGSADFLDSDGDGMNNWREWIAGTDPTDAASVLRLLKPTNDGSGITVSWQSVSSRFYFVERATNLGAAQPFSLLTSNIVGQAGTTNSTDTNAFGAGPFFYRVGVQQ